jgi:hypothetical protein
MKGRESDGWRGTEMKGRESDGWRGTEMNAAMVLKFIILILHRRGIFVARKYSYNSSINDCISDNYWAINKE